jgi:hypothetical protein
LIEFNKLTNVQKERLFNQEKRQYPKGVIDCQDYFGFNQVSVDISPVKNELVQGSSSTFSGKIINPFNYPIVEGQVFAKVFYKDSKSVTNEHLNGWRLVDQFIAVDNITLKANEQKPVTFSWKVPKYAREGNYEVSFYYTSAYHYSLTGLTFTNDITGNRSTFVIKSTSTEAVAYFDEDSVKLNDKNFYFAQPIPKFHKDDKVTSYINLINPKSTSTEVEISYKLYSWDSLYSGNLKNTITEIISLKAGEKKLLSYDIPIINNDVSYLVVEVKDHDTSSILDIRFARDGIDETHNNKLGIATYPLKAGATSTLFACTHSAGSNTVKDSVITITLKDTTNKILHTYMYAGGITSNVLGFKDDFVLDKDLYDFTVTSNISQAGKPFEEISIHYSCTEIDSSICPAKPSLSVPIKKNYNYYIYLMGMFLLTCICGGVSFFLRKKNQNKHIVV